MSHITIASKKVGSGEPCLIIAEASSNHGRDIKRAYQMIDVAADAGADVVKFQVFTAEKIAANTDDPRTIVRASEKAVFVKEDTKLIDLYRPNELPREWLPDLASYAAKKGILFMATPFDTQAVDQLEAVGVAAHKNASYELLDVPLLRKLASTGKPLIVSTGMADIGDVEFALRTLKEAGNSKIILLHCNSTYPVPPENINLRAMETMRRVFPDCPIGFSDHSMGIGVAIAAVALGASVIEKHFYLDDGVSTIDDQFSLSPAKFKEMVDSIRSVEKALGSSEKKPTKIEEYEKLQARRSLWVVKDIAAGEALSPENVQSLRPGVGLDSRLYDLVMGKKASRDLKIGKALEWEDVFLT